MKKKHMKKSPRQSIISYILLVFVLFNAVSLLVFTYIVLEKDRRQADENAAASLLEIASEKASLISLTLNTVARETEALALWAEEYITSWSGAESLSSQYYFDQEGVLRRRQSQRAEEGDRSNVFLPARTEMDLRQISIINATEGLDRHFIRLLNNQEAIQWVYISTEDGLLRCYPYDGLEYNPSHQQKEDHFYIIANEDNNPQRRSVWTSPYTDFLGTGWMISCSHPVYIGDEFIGVVSSDVRIETLQSQFLYDLRLGGNAKVFLLNDQGDIIYHPDYETEAWQKGQVYLKNIFAEGELSFWEDAAVNEALEGEAPGLITYRKELGAKERVLAYGKIPSLGWTVAVEIDKSEYWAAYYLNENGLILFFAITVLTLLALAYFLSVKISRPMGQLVEQAEQIAEGQYHIRQMGNQHREIHTLSEAFNTMSQRIKDYTDDLIRKNKEVESILNSIRGLLMILDKDGGVMLLNEGGRRLAMARREYQDVRESGAAGKRDSAVGRKAVAAEDRAEEAAVAAESDGAEEMVLAAEVAGRPWGSLERCYRLFCGRESMCRGCRLRDVFETGEDLYCQIVWEGRIFNNSYFPVFGRDGSVAEVVVYSVDVTERVLLEKQLQQGEKMAGIGQISTAIAHELKNPLAVIKGSAYLLKSYGDEGEDCGEKGEAWTAEERRMEEQRVKERREVVDTIWNAVEEAEQVIYSLLDFSGRKEETTALVDVTKIVGQLLLLNNHDCIKQGIETITDFKPSPLVYLGNMEAMKSVLQNIISNAIHAMETGGVLRIEGRRESRQDEEWLKIAVRDTGQGMSQKDLEKIYQPFFTSGSGRGTGLGLWITKRLVEKMEGTIRVESQEGRGTEFLLAFPVGGQSTEKS